MRSSAVLSPNRKYRYLLQREWDGNRRHLVIIGLNPSTADENNDDPTIRRCIGFAKRWNYGGLDMLNLFAFRATKPNDLFLAKDPVGPKNDEILLQWTDRAFTIAAWGTHGVFEDRGMEVYNLLSHRMLHCLGVTKDGHPKHPLYLPLDAYPILWSGPNDHR